MEAVILIILKYAAAIILGAGSLKAGEMGYKKLRSQKEETLTVSPESCFLKHKRIDERLNEIHDDLKGVKEALSTLVDLQISQIEMKSQLKEEIRDEIDKHESNFHNRAA